LRAASAADASVGINVIDISGGDSVNRTNRLASTACDAVVADYVCHDFFSCLDGYFQLQIYCNILNAANKYLRLFRI